MSIDMLPRVDYVRATEGEEGEVSYQRQQPRDEDWRKHVKPPSKSLTMRQWVWLVVQGVASTGICWGVNYGISIGVYRNAPPPTLWQFPLPIAGHFGVLCIVETLINWVIIGSLQALDLKSGLVAPLHPDAVRHWWPAPENHLTWWLRPSDLVIPPEAVREQPIPRRVLSTLVRSIPWMVFVFVLVFPSFCLVTYSLWGENGYNSFPLPQYLTATFGGLIALVSVPFWSMMSLVYIGRRVVTENDVSLPELSPERNVSESRSPSHSPQSMRSSPGKKTAKGHAGAIAETKFSHPRSPDSPMSQNRKINMI